MSVDTNTTTSTDTNSSSGVRWTPPDHVGDFGNFGLICLEFLIYVGMNSCDSQMQNNMDYDNAMQPAQGDIIAWLAYLNKIEIEASKSGITNKAELDNLVKEMMDKFKKFFGGSVLPKPGDSWPSPGQKVASGAPGYIDKDSDFGKWMAALWKANTYTDSSGKTQFINGWTGYAGDSAVAQVTGQIRGLDVYVPGDYTHTFLWYLENGNSAGVERDVNGLAANYWAAKQPNSSTNTDTNTDYLSNFVTDANATDTIFRGIGTAQTTLLQQLSATLNGEQNNGNSMIESNSKLMENINSHTGNKG
jgi:hypothetical protein